MPYILYKTDGTKLVTVDDATLDLSTDLSFVGRNYSGYGQVVNENFLRLLENFSNTTPPTRPIRGQLWYDKTNARLNVSYDGKSFKGIANIFVQPATPDFNALSRGDLWWDSDAFQLKAFDGSRFQVVGPFNLAAGRATWLPSEEETGIATAVTTPVTRAVIDEETIAIVSRQDFDVQNPNLVEKFPLVKRGITLSGTDPGTGNSANTGTILWGSASHALYADTSTLALFALDVQGGATAVKSSSSTEFVSYFSTATTSTESWTIAERDVNGNLFANLFVGIATSARYADLAERYEADNIYEPGTVLIIGGEKEVTVTNVQADVSAIGIVSANPALMMNAEAGPDDTHPYIALKGRVPCKVFGKIKKGQLLVTSNKPGYAQAFRYGDSALAVVAKALEDHDSSDFGTIEVLVV